MYTFIIRLVVLLLYIKRIRAPEVSHDQVDFSYPLPNCFFCIFDNLFYIYFFFGFLYSTASVSSISIASNVRDSDNCLGGKKQFSFTKIDPYLLCAKFDVLNSLSDNYKSDLISFSEVLYFLQGSHVLNKSSFIKDLY